MSPSVRDAAKQAACEVRDRLGARANDYQVGCMVEAALDALAHTPGWAACKDRPHVIDVPSREF